MKETKATLEMYAAKKERDERLVTRNWYALWTALSALVFLSSVWWLVTKYLIGSSTQGAGNFALILFSAIATPLFWFDWRLRVDGAKKAEKEYQEALDKAMPLKKARPAGQKKKPKGGQD